MTPQPLRIHRSPSLDSTNAVRNPATVISPAKLWADANASGIIVSTNIVRIAPAATAVVAAITFGEKCRNTAYPTSAAMPLTTAITPHTPNTYCFDRPALRMPAELESPSGMFDRKIATTATQLTAPPAIIDTPITIDSGIPSISAPTAIARPDPSASHSLGC